MRGLRGRGTQEQHEHGSRIGGVLLGLVGATAGVATVGTGLVKRRPELVRQAWIYALLVLGGAVLAVVAMERALITGTSPSSTWPRTAAAAPALYNVATLWAALEGSILLWALVLSGYLVALARRFRARLADPSLAGRCSSCWWWPSSSSA